MLIIQVVDSVYYIRLGLGTVVGFEGSVKMGVWAATFPEEAFSNDAGHCE